MQKKLTNSGSIGCRRWHATCCQDAGSHDVSRFPVLQVTLAYPAPWENGDHCGSVVDDGHNDKHDHDWVTDIGGMETFSFASSKALEIPVSVRMFVTSALSLRLEGSLLMVKL